MVSVKSSIQSLNFMVTTGIVIQTSFLMENAIHSTVKDKDDNPITVKHIRTLDHQRIQDLQGKGYTIEIIWEKDWQALLTQRPDIKSYLLQHRTNTHFKKYLTQVKSFNTSKMGTCLGLSDVTLKFRSISKNTFPK